MRAPAPRPWPIRPQILPKCFTGCSARTPNDPQLGTQVLICASEAAQQDPLQPYQRGMCKAVMDAAFPVDGGRPSLDRSRDLQMAELRNQSIVKVLTALPANTTPAQRNELARILRDLLN